MDSNIKVGDRALARVGRNMVEVVVEGIEGGRYRVGSLSTGRRFVAARVEPLPGAETDRAREAVGAPAAAPEAETPHGPEPAADPAPARARRRRKTSLLDAAATVLGESDAPMGVAEILGEAVRRGLWTPGAGKTPLQTLYSSIFREIGGKGAESRFVKAARGRFALRR